MRSPNLPIVQAGARQPVWKVRGGCTGRIKRVLCPWRGIHDLCVDRHSARFEPSKKSQYTGPKVIFKTLVEMRHSGLMALKARFRIRHKP